MSSGPVCSIFGDSDCPGPWNWVHLSCSVRPRFESHRALPTTYQDLVEKLVDAEIEERSVITEWATCASCGENRHSKARKSCKTCETVEDIRWVVPKDF